MAIEFKDVSEPAASPTKSVTELPMYQRTIVPQNGLPTSTTNHPSELTVVDSVPKPERSENENLKKQLDCSMLQICMTILVKSAEIVFNILSFILVRESNMDNTTSGICSSLVSSLGVTISGCLFALYACGGFKRPCITVHPFEYVFCILWACASLAAAIFLDYSHKDIKDDCFPAPMYGIVTMMFYGIDACLSCTVTEQQREELKLKQKNRKVCDNSRAWNQPASEAYNGTECSGVNNNDPNDHWTRSYDLNAISDGCIIIF